MDHDSQLDELTRDGQADVAIGRGLSPRQAVRRNAYSLARFYAPWWGAAMLLASSAWLPAAEITATSLGTPLSQSGTNASTAPRHFTPQAGAQLYDHGNPTAHEQYMLELVNRARANPTAEAARLGIDLNQGLNPGTITAAPKQPLALHRQLIEAARGHSQWMLDNDIFSHDGAGGSSPGDRMEAAGYPLWGSWKWGENIAWRGSNFPLPLTPSTSYLHDNLFKSPGHRENLLDEDFDQIGIGIQQGGFVPTNGYELDTVMATQDFATSDGTPGPFVLGVIYRDANANNFYDPGEGVSGVTVRPASGTWYAISSASGGYAFPYSGSGSLSVTFSGGSLPASHVVAVTRTGQNVKLDVETSLITVPSSFVANSALWTDKAGFQVQVSGGAGSTFVLQVSDDLVHWQDVGTYGNPSGLTQVQDGAAVQTGLRFYRLRLP